MSDNSDGAMARHPSHVRPPLRVVTLDEDAIPSVDEAATSEALRSYLALLERSPLSANTRRAYGRQVQSYLAWLEVGGAAAGDALGDPLARDFAVRDYRRALKDGRLGPSSVNAALSAIDHLYRSIHLGPPRVRRERLPAQAPRALDETELRSVLRSAERRGSSRDRAAIGLMAYAGLRVSEVAGLDVDDVALSARKGTVTVRHGKGDTTRSVPLNTEARGLLAQWLQERGGAATPALFVAAGRDGKRLTSRSLDRVVRAVGAAVGLSLSPHVLRHTFVTRLVRSGTDVVLVAELAGHRSLETTRRYSLPTAADRQAAVELAGMDP